ncbi:MAG TPA: c-type cytochrome, partial [Thermoanaerobaculia bacterium]|nr:c-type cytochrome [Thermoanaerobaculia bacterium]
MRRRTMVILGITAAIAGFAAFDLVSTIRRGLSTRDEPKRMEAIVARSMRHWAVPADLRDAKNPVALTPAILTEAREHWADHCAICHGNDGRGQTAIGHSLYPRAPDMISPRTQNLSDGELFAIIENGVRLTGMPGWGDGTDASKRSSWTLVHFIRHLPKIAPEELRSMEAMNP